MGQGHRSLLRILMGSAAICAGQAAAAKAQSTTAPAPAVSTPATSPLPADARDVAAQTGTPAPATADNDIVVTAQKRRERIQDVPLAISAITSETIERSGSRSLRDIATSVPSLYFSQSQGPVQSNVAIRGIGSNGGVAGLEPSVGIYVDGVYLDRTSIGVADFNDIERIEVLRGPQGTLFGKNTPAGLINFITKRPSFKWTGDATASVGNYNDRGATASVSGPILADKLAIRVSGFYRKRDGYLHNDFNNKDVNDLKAYGIRGRLLFKPIDALEMLATVEHQVTDQDCCAAEFAPVGGTQRTVAAALGNPFPAVIDGEDRHVYYDGTNAYHHTINAYTLENNLRLGDYTLTSISSLRDYKQTSHIDGDFSQLDFFRIIEGDRNHRQFSQEVRLASPDTGMFSFVTGLFYFYKRQNERGFAVYGADTSRIFTLLGGTLRALAPTYATIRRSDSGSDIVNRSYAAFGQGKVAFSDQFDVSLGVRYTYDKKRLYTFQTTTEVVPILAPRRNVNAEKGDGHFSGVINARFRPDSRTMLYASLTRGYKAFGFNDSAVNEAIGQRRFFDAELSTGGEVGLKKTWNGFQLNLTGFYTKFSNYQASSFAPGNTFLLQNAAKLTTKGVEVEAILRPAAGFVLNANYTYLDAKYDSFPTGPGLEGGAVTQDLSGKPLQDAPKHSLNLVAQYDRSLGGGFSGFVRGEYSYRSKIYTAQNLDPLLIQPGYSLINARVGISRGPVGLELWGRNLTDEVLLYRGGTPPAVFTAGSRIRFIGDPATYGATLRLAF